MKIATENPSYQRDMHSKALVQTNRKDLDEYKLKAKMLANMKEKTEEINKINSRLDELEVDIKDIKELLRGLVNK